MPSWSNSEVAYATRLRMLDVSWRPPELNSQLQVVNALAVLLELHRARVVDVEDDIEEGELNL